MSAVYDASLPVNRYGSEQTQVMWRSKLEAYLSTTDTQVLSLP